MSTLQVNNAGHFSIDATVRESDRYSESILVKFTRSYSEEDTAGCNEMFLTPNQLEKLGMFFVRQAAEIRGEQEFRKRKL
jgi:hypothetical protein